MIVAELPRAIYTLDAILLAVEKFNEFCGCSLSHGAVAFRLEIVPRVEVDAFELSRSLLNYALAGSMERRIESQL